MKVIDDETKKLALQIGNYLKSHPAAMDSVEGITMWWISQQRYIENVEKITKTLNYMYEQKLITRIILADGREVYKKI